MRKLSLFIAVFFSALLINIGVSRAHVEPEEPFGGPFIGCESLSLTGDVEEYDVDFDVCYENELWEQVDEAGEVKNGKMTLSYHNVLRDAEDNVILPESEIIDPANIDWTTRDMGFKELDDIEDEDEPDFGETNFESGICDVESFEESPRADEEDEFNQIEFEEIELLDIFVNFNDDVAEADKPEATNELEEWVETIRTVVDEGGTLEAEVDVKFLHNAKGGNPNGAMGNEHHKVFDSCDQLDIFL